MLKLTFDDYEKWAKKNWPDSETQPRWKRWDCEKLANYTFEERGHELVTQEEMLELHYNFWLRYPDEARQRSNGSIIAFFTRLEPEYSFAVSVLGEDYFA